MKHTLNSKGHTWIWDDTDPVDTEERKLLDIYNQIGSLHKWTMYEGTDPYETFNKHVSQAQEAIINWLIELKQESK